MAKNQTIELQTIVKKKTTILESTVDDEIVMANFATDSYYGLDAVSSYIWRLLARPWSVQDLCAHLCEEFEVTEEICRQDVLEFLRKMAEEELVDVGM